MTAGALVISAIGVALLAGAWRSLEAGLSARLATALKPALTVSDPGSDLMVLTNHGRPLATFLLDSECSVAYLVALVLLAAAPMALMTRLGPVRAVLAGGIAAGTILLVNVGRLAMIAVTVADLGLARGFTVGHTYVGPVVMFLGMTVAAAGFVVPLLWRQRAPAR